MHGPSAWVGLPLGTGIAHTRGMRLASFSLLLVLGGCAQLSTADVDARAADAAPLGDDATNDGGCLHWARPTGTCTQPDTCCVSSTCIDGICQ